MLLGTSHRPTEQPGMSCVSLLHHIGQRCTRTVTADDAAFFFFYVELASITINQEHECCVNKAIRLALALT